MELTIGFIGCFFLVLFITAGVPLAFGIGLVAIIGNSILVGFTQTGIQIYQITFQTTTEFVMTSIPLFIFMGQLVSEGRLGKDLYECVYKWLGRIPGGLAVTSVVSCASFGALTGISSAGISTMGPIAMREMRRYGYAEGLAAGSLASASTLAILIPPSVPFIVYGIWTDTSIGQLFMAGVVPGIILTLVFCAYVIVLCIWKPELGPVAARFALLDRLLSLVRLSPLMLVFTIMIVGLYQGWFTPAEGAAVGCTAVMLILLVMGRLNWASLAHSARASAQLSIMIFMIVITVQLFTRFLVLTDVPGYLIALIGDAGLNRYIVLLIIIIMYLILGMMLDSLGMMLLTLPFVFPIILHLGFDAVWFGVILTLMVEIGLLTPPVGMNCYILNKVSPETSLGTIFKGVLPFVFLTLAMVGVFVAFPDLVLWLPRQMFS
ncbi:TRAP transporter large permease [Aquabacter sp. CN5-332]|uniref:TRAP transporter large permease n=1 Tax=Aquabacter sp. CN5-332 TaxID=3156608 RepID=UPI0032B4A5A7